MSDFHILEDQAVLYVMDQLPAVERREFETHLAESAELRALVHELEEGIVAFSMASPRRRPPQEVWARIEKAVARDESRKVVTPAFWTGWWRNGWAAAAVCLIGWSFYALWVNRESTPAAPGSIVSTVNSQQEAALQDSRQTKAGNATAQPSAVPNPMFRLLQTKTQEISALRLQMAELTNQMTHLSQALTQQQTFLLEPDRIKFFQLVPTSSNGGTVATVPISTNLQRALFFAMARELGWTKSSDTTSTPGLNTENKHDSQSGTASSTQTNQSGVDFVDLRSQTNTVTPPSDIQTQVAQEPSSTDSPLLASVSSNAVPGFVSGTNAILAFDSSVVPVNSYLMFSAASLGQYQFLGGAVMGDNPLVVTIPFSGTAWSGWNLGVSVITMTGSNGALISFSMPVSLPP